MLWAVFGALLNLRLLLPGGRSTVSSACTGSHAQQWWIQ
jgi:hypothetical protein